MLKEFEPIQLALESYEKDVQRCVQQLTEQKAAYSAAFAECLQEIERAETQKDEMRKRIIACNKEIAENDFVTPKYYYLIDTIIDLLESGRADTYKEALNMAIEQKEQQDHRRALEGIKREELEHAKEAQRKQDKINDLLEEELLHQIHDRYYKK